MIEHALQLRRAHQIGLGQQQHRLDLPSLTITR